MLSPPHRGGRIWPRRNAHGAHFASANRVRPNLLFCCCNRFSTPLLHEMADLPTQSLIIKSLIFDFSRTSQAKSLVWASPLAAHNSHSQFFADPPSNISTFPLVLLQPIRGTLQGGFSKPSWGLLGPSWGLVGPSWAILGPSWALLEPSFSHLVTILAHWALFGGSSEASRGPLGPFLSQGNPLGASWGHLGTSWGHLGLSWNLL